MVFAPRPHPPMTARMHRVCEKNSYGRTAREFAASIVTSAAVVKKPPPAPRTSRGAVPGKGAFAIMASKTERGDEYEQQKRGA